MTKFIIPDRAYEETFTDDLRLCRIDETTLFPDLEHLATGLNIAKKNLFYDA